MRGGVPPSRTECTDTVIEPRSTTVRTRDEIASSSAGASAPRSFRSRKRWLTARTSTAARVEVLHCATEPVLTTSDHADIIGRTVGISVRCGEPRSAFDHLINRKVMHNREFAFGRWNFDCSTLCHELGVRRFGVPLTEVFAMAVLVSTYESQTPRGRRKLVEHFPTCSPAKVRHRKSLSPP